MARNFSSADPTCRNRSLLINTWLHMNTDVGGVSNQPLILLIILVFSSSVGGVAAVIVSKHSQEKEQAENKTISGEVEIQACPPLMVV